MDERVLEEYGVEEISIGDFVLTGGELPAVILTDAVARMLPGVLSEDVCFEEESHFDGLLEYPQYTRPSVWRGRAVPEVLMSGHHENIRKWRRRQSFCARSRRAPTCSANTRSRGRISAFGAEIDAFRRELSAGGE